jgi:excisionase family DNA binding protein
MSPIPPDQVSPHDKRTGRRSDRAASTPIGAVNLAGRATAPPHANVTHCTIRTAVEKLCCVRSHVYNLLGAGKIRGVKSGRRTLITISSIDEYLANLAPATIKPPRPPQPWRRRPAPPATAAIARVPGGKSTVRTPRSTAPEPAPERPPRSSFE